MHVTRTANTNQKNDLLSGTISEDNTPFESSPFVGFAVDANEANAAPGGRRKKPPHFHGSGDCCKPTEKCHAYVTWMLEMQNTNGWESEAQRREANSHVECCMRQYHASCSTSMQGNTIIWRDPTKHCSPNQGSEVPQHDETEHEGEKPQEEGVKNTPVEDEGAESKPEA